MGRVIALTRDLLFGSRLQGMLSAAGHEVAIVADEGSVRGRLAEGRGATVLLADLTDPDLHAAETVRGLGDQGGEWGPLKTLAFYSHVEVSSREEGERAGFDLVVPRSRMAREGAELVGRLLQEL